MPVEVKARDFLPRLLISVELLRRGYGIIFGQQSEIKKNISYLPIGLYFDKSLSINKEDFLIKLKEVGHKIVSLDEEGLASRNNEKSYLNQRLTEKTVNLAETIFTWGNEEKKIILKKYFKYEKKIKNTGNPRIDILKSQFHNIFKKRADSYKSKYGDFIFFASNFASVNHQLGEAGLRELHKNLDRLKTENEKQYFEERLLYFEKTFLEFRDLVIATVNSFPNINIIVRPHTVEDRSFWDKLAYRRKNLIIEDKGSFIPWMLASRVLIHSSCTTGIEAYAAGKTVMSFLPFKHEYSNHISNKASLVHKKKEQLIDNLNDLLYKEQPLQPASVLLDKEIEHTIKNCKSEISYELIADHIDKIDLKETVFQKSILPKRYLYRIKNSITSFFGLSRDFKLRKKKFDSLTLEEILLNMDEIRKSINYDDSPVVKKIFTNSFLLTPSKQLEP